MSRFASGGGVQNGTAVGDALQREDEEERLEPLFNRASKNP